MTTRTERAHNAECPEKPVAFCGGHRALLVATSGILAAVPAGHRRCQTGVRSSSPGSEMLTKLERGAQRGANPCQGRRRQGCAGGRPLTADRGERHAQVSGGQHGQRDGPDAREKVGVQVVLIAAAGRGPQRLPPGQPGHQPLPRRPAGHAMAALAARGAQLAKRLPCRGARRVTAQPDPSAPTVRCRGQLNGQVPAAMPALTQAPGNAGLTAALCADPGSHTA